MEIIKIVGTSSKMLVFFKDSSILEMKGELTIGGFAASMNSMRWMGDPRIISLKEKNILRKEIIKENRRNNYFVFDIYPD